MKKISKILLICSAFISIVGCSNGDTSSNNKNQDDYILVSKNLEYYRNLTFNELYEIKEQYYLKNKDLIDKNILNFDVFNDTNIYQYYGSFKLDDSKIVILSLLEKDRGLPGVMIDVALGNYEFKFSGMAPSVYYFKNKQFYTLEEAYSANYLSNEVLEKMKKGILF